MRNFYLSNEYKFFGVCAGISVNNLRSPVT